MIDVVGSEMSMELQSGKQGAVIVDAKERNEQFGIDPLTHAVMELQCEKQGAVIIVDAK